MSDAAPTGDPVAPGLPPKEGSLFRGIIGFLCIGGSLAGFLLLYFVPLPEGNENSLIFAMGIVFGWGGLVVSSEYGASQTGRRVAESAIKKMEEPTS